MDRHHPTVFFILVFSLFSLFLSGCDRSHRSSTSSTLTNVGNVKLGDARSQKEDFDRAIAMINRLEDSPTLPDTPGYERIASAADRLNKWIQNQKPDDSWNPLSPFQNVEQASKNAAEAAQNVVRSLRILQGERDSDAIQTPLSLNLLEERQAVSSGLNSLNTQVQTLVALADLNTLGQFTEIISQLQSRMNALNNIPNLNVSGIQSFAKQLNNETGILETSVEMFEAFATQLKAEGLFLSASDIEYIKQSTWTRDLSQWVSGDKQVLLEQAIQICDWVACNIDMGDRRNSADQVQLMGSLSQHPWQTILLGHGIPYDRIAVFIELLRQRRIDAALLGTTHPSIPNSTYFWGVGVLLHGEVYVFLPHYGFPIPSANGIQFSEKEGMKFTGVATLTQLIQDDSLLRRLDLSDEHTFSVTSEMLKQTTAYLYVMPESVSMRMKVLEAELSGEQNAVLYTDAQELRRRFLAVPGISGVELWKYPLRTAFEQRFIPEETNKKLGIFLVNRPRLNLDDMTGQNYYPLWSGRVLYFKGSISGRENALIKYQNAKISDKEMIEYRNDPDFRNNPEINQRLQWLSLQASYWLGTTLFEIDSIDAAKDCLEEIRTNPMNVWQSGTEYLLGRIAEKEKRYDDAKKHYSNTATTLSGEGNAIRAKWLPSSE